ncbi:MAG: VOC family protein [Chloroflexi bacterium]|nr:VOC family protein [Chloroflexota bacterium]
MPYAFNHVHIKATDPERTANWYVQAFNFRIVRDTVRDMGDRFIQCRTVNDVGITISNERTNEYLAGGNASPHWGIEHFGIEVDDIEAEIQRLEGMDARLMEGPLGQSGATRIAWIKGPDDTRIELMQLAPSQ